MGDYPKETNPYSFALQPRQECQVVLQEMSAFWENACGVAIGGGGPLVWAYNNYFPGARSFIIKNDSPSVATYALYAIHKKARHDPRGHEIPPPDPGAPWENSDAELQHNASDPNNLVRIGFRDDPHNPSPFKNVIVTLAFSRMTMHFEELVDAWKKERAGQMKAK